jgi:cellulase/cellobiase CelA1
MIGPFITDTSPTWSGQVQVMRSWMTRRAAWLDGTNAWGGGTTTPPPSSPPPSSPPPSSPPPTGGAACSAAYSQISQWQGGFQGEVRVTAGAARITAWTVTLTFANGQRVSQSWNAVAATNGATVTARNETHNGTLAPAASTTFGFLGSWSGSNAPPTVTCAAT